MLFASEFGTGDVLLAIFLFFALLLWVWLVLSIFADVIRSDDLSGWGKALWLAFLILVPLVSAFVYFVTRGYEMSERQYWRSQDRGWPSWTQGFY